MNTFKLFWDLHKWTGIAIAAVVVVTSVSGFFLLLKKEFAWIQPPTQSGEPGPPSAFIPAEQLFAVVFAEGHPDFRALEDIERVDVRPGKHVAKVHAARSDAEIQICMTTGRVLSVDVRRSDWFERLHDGSMIGKPFHDYVMPLVALALLFLVFSGLWLWLEPVVKRARRRRRDRRASEA